MKREILCVKCRNSLIGKIGEYPGEGHKFIKGKSRGGGIICDACCAPLSNGAECYGFSIFTDRRPYYPWEAEYMQVDQ